jgi:hypothetical protein
VGIDRHARAGQGEHAIEGEGPPFFEDHTAKRLWTEALDRITVDAADYGHGSLLLRVVAPRAGQGRRHGSQGGSSLKL